MADPISILDKDESKALEVLAFFYYQIGKFDSSKRTLLALLSVDPANVYAKGLLILCNWTLRDYDSVLKQTEDLLIFKEDKQRYQIIKKLRASALQKQGFEKEANMLINAKDSDE